MRSHGMTGGPDVDHEAQFAEMKAYVRFDDDDVERLAALWEHVRPRTREMAEVFYERILEFEDARTVFEDMEQVRRLQATLQIWVEELLRGPHDVTYMQRRRRIGDKHVRVGLAHRYMFTAMAVIQTWLDEVIDANIPADDRHPYCTSVRRITALDLALMTGTYLGAAVQAEAGDLAAVLLANVPTAAFLLEARGETVVAATEAGVALCSSPPVGQVLGAVLPARIYAALDLDDAIAQARDGGSVTRERVDVTCVEGDTRSFQATVTSMRGHGFGALVSLDEITQVVQAEAERRRRESLVQLGTLSALVAHEIRNPLAGISGALQVIGGTLDDDDGRKPIMGKVRTQIDRLDRMVHDLLAFARTPQARLQDVALDEVADVVDDLVRRTHPDAGLKRVGAGTALADPDLVQRITLNLVQNALAAGGPDVRVEVRVADGELLVLDDGPGIPADAAEQVFEPFFTTKTTGTGLGLAICRNAAEALGGTLTLVDDPTIGGATFRLAMRTRPSR